LGGWPRGGGASWPRLWQVTATSGRAGTLGPRDLQKF
jgi:hypothetical protein